jgi:hypothetical protein
MLVACLFVAAGCGPIEYTHQVTGNAARAVAEAKAANAEQLAPYEYTSAVAYFDKAREEGGYAAYQIAINYGHRAEDFAVRARAIAETKAASRPPGGAAVAEPSKSPGDSS